MRSKLAYLVALGALALGALTILALLSERYQELAPTRSKPSISSARSSADLERVGPLDKDFGDLFISASIGDASNLIPFISGDSASSQIEGLVYSSLLRIDKDRDLIPALARAWDISDHGKTITFYLRDDVKWSDGTDFTADDLLYQYELMINPDLPSPYKEPFLQIESARALDRFTFQVSYSKPYAPALSDLAGMTGLPRASLEGISARDLIRSKIARSPIGHGAYRLDEWKSQSHLSLSASPTYYEKGRPHIARLTVRIIPDTATQFLELKGGNLDMMGLDPIQYSRQTDTSYFRTNFRKYRYLANSYTYLGFNLLNPLFKDKRVRQALARAIDKEEIIKGALLGFGQPATGPYKPGSWAYADDVARYEYDPAAAAASLAEIGWLDRDGDGTLENENGDPFRFTIVTNQGNAARKKSAQIIQRQLARIKIDVKIKIIEWSSFLENFIHKRDFEATLLGWTLGLDPDIYIIWSSTQMSERGFNFISYSNPELDRLLEEGRRQFDQAARAEIYHRVHKILAEDQPYIFLYNPEATPIVSARIRGIVPGVAGIDYNFDRWWIAREDHKRALATIER